MSKERLTKTYNPCDGCNYAFHKQNQESGMCKLCEFKNYRNLEEQCLLLRLPVAIGTEVWTIMTGMTGKHPTLFRQRFELSMVQYWGTSAFLTRKEAEEKLRELEGK